MNDRRTLSLETLESRIALDAQGLCVTDLAGESPFVQGVSIQDRFRSSAVGFAEEPAVGSGDDGIATIQSSSSQFELDRDGNGRVDVDELARWLLWWKSRGEAANDDVETPRSEPAAPIAAPAPKKGSSDEPLPAAPYFGTQNDWHLNTINAPEAWEAGYTGEGVTVAVIDTGIDFRHSEFRGKLWRNTGEIAGNGRDDDGNGFVDDVHGWDFVNDDAVPQDTHGHGTHVAGLIAAARDESGATGAAYGAEIMVLQGLNGNGVGTTGDIARAIRYAVDEGADVVNLSLGGGESSAIRRAIAYAERHDVLIVAAAGNQGAGAPSAPASLSESWGHVISVGAVNSSGVRASFSNRAADAVQVTAPGTRLRSTVPGGYAMYSGTSMATPLVSAAAALTLAAAPQLTAEELRTVLTSTAEQQHASDDSHGLIDVAAAIGKARSLRRAA